MTSEKSPLLRRSWLLFHRTEGHSRDEIVAQPHEQSKVSGRAFSSPMWATPSKLMKKTSLWIASMLLIAIMPFDIACANGKFIPVALSGDMVPGTSFLIETMNGPISLNSSGQTAFAGTISGYGIGGYSSSVIFTEGSGPRISILARENSQVPTLEIGIRFDELANTNYLASIPKISDTGDTFFTTQFRGTVDFAGGLFRASAGSTTLEHVAVLGDQASGFDPSVTISKASLHFLNSAGDVVFLAGLNGEGINALTNLAIYKSSASIENLEVVVQKRDPIPGLPDQVFQWYQFLSLQGVDFDDNGAITISAGRNPQIILSDRGGSGLAPLVMTGDFIEPGVSVLEAGELSTNQAGDVFFSGQLTGPGVMPDDPYALLKYSDDGGLEVLLREGEAVDGFALGTVFSRENSQGPFTKFSANNLGQVVLETDLRGGQITPPTRRILLLLNEDGEQQVLARIGEEVPGTVPGVEYSLLYTSDINEQGQIFFRAQLSGDGVDISNDRALFAMDTDGVVKMLLREGDSMNVSRTETPDLRVVDSLYESRSGNSAYLNDSGQVAFKASFVDGTQGVFIANVGDTGPGDFDLDTDVDGGDFLYWQRNLGTVEDLTVWKSQFGVGTGSSQNTVAFVPEPTTETLLLLLSLCRVESYKLARRRKNR